LVILGLGGSRTWYGFLGE